MKKRIKTNCNYTLKPETHSFLGEKGKQIIFSGSGYAECEGTNAIIVNRNQYYNADSSEFNNNSFGVGSAMNKRLRCNTFSFQIRNKNLYGADLLNLRVDVNNDWLPTTLTADPATGAVHWVAPNYGGDSGVIYPITFFNGNGGSGGGKLYNAGNTPLYFSCFAKGLKITADFGIELTYNNENTTEHSYTRTYYFQELKNGGLILNTQLSNFTGGVFYLISMSLFADYVTSELNRPNAQDVWFYPVISTEPITEEFFDNYVGFVPFPAYSETDGYPFEDDKKQTYTLPYSFDTPFTLNDYNVELSQEFVNEIFKYYGYRYRNHYRNKAVPWGSLEPTSENLYYQWVWNTLNTGIMGNDWGTYPIEESLTPLALLYKPLFMLGYHHGGLSLISTGEKISPFAQDAVQEIRPVIQTLVFVNYETQVPDYISPVFTIVYPTLVNAD